MRSTLALLLIVCTALFCACDEDTTNITGSYGVGAILGRVFEFDGQPIENATITTDPATETVESDESGYFRFNNLTVAAYFVSVSKPGYRTSTFPVAVEAGLVSHVSAVLNSTDPDTVRLVSSFSTGGRSVGIAVRQTTAFVLGDAGLQIFDLSNPAESVLLGQVVLPPYAYGDVELLEDAAYIATTTSVLIVVNVADPGMPFIAEEAQVGSRQLHDVELDGSTVVCAAGDSVIVLDAQHPLAPTRLGAVASREGSFGQGNNGVGLDSTRDLAFVCSFNDGIDIIDYSSPESPRIIGHFGSSSFNPRDTVVDPLAQRAVVACDDGLLTLSYAQPNNPQWLGQWRHGGNGGQDVAVYGSLALEAAQFNGLNVANISDPAHIRGRQRLSNSTVGDPQNIALWGSRAYVAAGDRLLVVDFPEGGQ